MKIGILTFHRAHNYGAMLQAYALKKVLCNMGHEVGFIGYRQDAIERAYKVIDFRRYTNTTLTVIVKIFILRLFTFRRRFIRHSRFEKFRNKYLGEDIQILESDNEIKINGLDAVIFGSDQIWTTRFLGSFDDVYWGNLNVNQAKRIAYAPSMELKHLNEDQIRYVKEHLGNFDCVSTREIGMQNLLASIQNIQYPLVLDPTLLCTKEDYSEFFKNKKSKYLLLYQVGIDNTTLSVANYVADILGLSIIELTFEVALKVKNNVKDTVGPDTFVGLIKNADYVVTNSFHGTAFSVNFNIPFLSVLIPGREGRAKSLLETVKLEERGVYSTSDIKNLEMNTDDFDFPNQILRDERKKSMDYLKKALEL